VTPPRTTVIVLDHEGARWLPRCLGALATQQGDFEIVVVDNASTIPSATACGPREGLRVLRLDENAGFAGGNNAGALAAAASDYLVFLNNDTEVQQGWLAALTGALDADPGAALATSHVVRLDDPSVVDSAGDGYLRAGGAYKRWHGQCRPPGDAVEDVFGACGAAFAIRRRVFERLGGFDERFFMVYEDVDLSYRARLAGGRCVYVPGAVVRHAGSASLGVESEAAVFYGQRNLEWTWVKNTPAALLWRDALPHVAYSLAGVAYYASRGRLRACLAGKLAALAGLPAVARDRPPARVETARIASVLDRRWWRVKRAEPRWADPLPPSPGDPVGRGGSY
jgi:GT2 family glycosyltransferase